MSLDIKYPIIDNYIYLYHTNEILVLPVYPEQVTDSMQADFSSETPLSRSAPIYSYRSSGPRAMQFSFNLHRELMNQINYEASNIDIARIRENGGGDYVDYIIKVIQAAALPVYSDALKMVNPPVVAVKLGSDIFIKGVVNGTVGVTYAPPIIPGRKPDGSIDNSQNKFAQITIAFNVYEIEPYDALTVQRDGSYRGLSKTLERFTYGDFSSVTNKNYYRSTKGGWR